MGHPRTLSAIALACVLLVGCTADPATPDTGPDADPAKPEGTPLAAAAECAVPAGLAGQDLVRLPIKKRLIALTFDAGANADGVRSIRRTLRRRNVKATFFLTGRFVQSFPVKSRRLADRDLVGNHTMTHPDLTTLSDQRVVDEVRAAEAEIRTTTGEDPRRFFRFPFGARTTHLVELLNELCYVPFRWTVDTLGWKGTSGGQSVSTVVARVVDAAKPGAIVLMHVGSHPKDRSTLDADALPRVIKRLRGMGYGFVRLGYVMDPAP